MKKEWLIKTLALGIVVLFICMNVNPSFAVDNVKKTSITRNQNTITVVPSTGNTVLDKSYVNLLYTTHDPIYIHGNNDFTSENGVSGGSGTSNDPYIIEGWEIDASSQDGIIIKNTSVFFEIKNCYVYDGGTDYDGIVFYNVTNGVISNNIITQNRNGIMFRTQGYPFKENSCYNKIQGNDISYNTFDGINFEHTMEGHHSYNQIFFNNITGNDNEGIYLIMSQENHIYCNNIISNSAFGVELYTCTGGGGDNKVYHNNFIENDGENGQAACTMDYNDWDDGYPSGGNFWSDYTGSDSNGDGIGDDPYVIFSYYYENDYDWYPLMNLYGNWTYSPFAKFTWTPSLPEQNETILFNASESIDYNGNITLYEWDWNNDGIFDENHTSSTAAHIYEELGYYPVTLRVTDNDNLTDSKTKTVRVGNQPPYVPSNPYPPGDFPVDIHVILSWDGGDPDPDDSVTYDVYFGRDVSPPLVAIVGPYPANQIRIQYYPGTLEYYTTYYWRIVAHDNYDASTPSPTWTFTTAINFPPTPPSIDGQTKGKPGKSYDYTFVSTDPEGENVYYFIYWGDGNYSGWIGPYASGVAVTQSHTWAEKGTFVIRAQAKDIYGMKSEWSTFEVIIPRNGASYGSLFLRFLEQFPNAFPILKCFVKWR